MVSYGHSPTRNSNRIAQVVSQDKGVNLFLCGLSASRSIECTARVAFQVRGVDMLFGLDAFCAHTAQSATVQVALVKFVVSAI